MPTGEKHHEYESQEADEWTKECRCTIGEDHFPGGNLVSDVLSEDDAELIWLSSGMDEDYDFRSE